MRRILLQFPGFGVIDVITRAIARKEMRTYVTTFTIDSDDHRYRCEKRIRI